VSEGGKLETQHLWGELVRAFPHRHSETLFALQQGTQVKQTRSVLSLLLTLGGICSACRRLTANTVVRPKSFQMAHTVVTGRLIKKYANTSANVCSESVMM